MLYINVNLLIEDRPIINDELIKTKSTKKVISDDELIKTKHCVGHV